MLCFFLSLVWRTYVTYVHFEFLWLINKIYHRNGVSCIFLIHCRVVFWLWLIYHWAEGLFFISQVVDLNNSSIVFVKSSLNSFRQEIPLLPRGKGIDYTTSQHKLFIFSQMDKVICWSPDPLFLRKSNYYEHFYKASNKGIFAKEEDGKENLYQLHYDLDTLRYLCYIEWT